MGKADTGASALAENAFLVRIIHEEKHLARQINRAAPLGGSGPYQASWTRCYDCGCPLADAHGSVGHCPAVGTC